MKSVAIEGQLRTEMGKGAAKKLRAQGNVLAIIYGGEKEVHFHAPLLAVRDIIYTHEFKSAEITVDGKSYKCILKDAQFCPITDKVTHIDFLELVEGKRLIANIPVILTGQAEGVKAGGRLEQKMKSLKVRTMPNFLKESITLDITELQLHGNLRVQDVNEEGFEIMNPGRQPIASIVTTRELRQAGTEGEGEGAEGTEGAEGAEGAAAE